VTATTVLGLDSNWNKFVWEIRRSGTAVDLFFETILRGHPQSTWAWRILRLSIIILLIHVFYDFGENQGVHNQLSMNHQPSVSNGTLTTRVEAILVDSSTTMLLTRTSPRVAAVRVDAINTKGMTASGQSGGFVKELDIANNKWEKDDASSGA
jgi:hypothetical protein